MIVINSLKVSNLLPFVGDIENSHMIHYTTCTVCVSLFRCVGVQLS